MLKTVLPCDSKASWMIWLLPGLLLVIPFLVVTFPPSTDLPQQVAQMRLLGQALSGETDRYLIAWYNPNTLIYVFMGGVWLLATPLLTGRILLILLAFAWYGALVYLGRQRNRPPASVILASVLFFNLSLYWGLLGFLLGWPFFVLFLDSALKPLTWKRWGIMVGISALLFLSHSLWFAAGGLALGAVVLWRRDGWRAEIIRLSSMVPIGIWALIWYQLFARKLVSTGSSSAIWWTSMPHERLMPMSLVNSMLGGLRDLIEPATAALLLAWVVAALITNRKVLRQRCDPPLLVVSAVFFALVFFAPNVYMNTLLFSTRWLPCAATLLLLGLPAPAMRHELRRLMAVVIVFMFCVVTAVNWHYFESHELDGLREALRQIPPDSHVLGLDYYKESPRIKGRPYMHMYAYSQVLKDCSLNFTFAWHGSALVQLRDMSANPWTKGLEWYSERARVSDLSAFDYVLVHGDQAVRERLAMISIMLPVTPPRRWQLFEVNTAVRRLSPEGTLRPPAGRPDTQPQTATEESDD